MTNRVTDLDLSMKLKDVGICQQSGLFAYSIDEVKDKKIELPEGKKVLCVGYADWQLMSVVGKICDGNPLGFPLQSRVQPNRMDKKVVHENVYVFSYGKLSFIAKGDTICEVMVDVLMYLIKAYGVSVGKINDLLKETKDEPFVA